MPQQWAKCRIWLFFHCCGRCNKKLRRRRERGKEEKEKEKKEKKREETITKLLISFNQLQSYSHSLSSRSNETKTTMASTRPNTTPESGQLPGRHCCLRRHIQTARPSTRFRHRCSPYCYCSRRQHPSPSPNFRTSQPPCLVKLQPPHHLLLPPFTRRFIIDNLTPSLQWNHRTVSPHLTQFFLGNGWLFSRAVGWSKGAFATSFVQWKVSQLAASLGDTFQKVTTSFGLTFLPPSLLFDWVLSKE